jgi:ubiquinone/menaquinone biosynthesis C-methylase UbiE
MWSTGQVVLVQSLERMLLRLLSNWKVESLSAKRILDVGCGGGQWLGEFIRFGAEPENLVGIDLVEEHVARARRSLPSAVTLKCCSAAELPFPDRSFDLVSQFTVFTSILEGALKQRVAMEMKRVLRPDGVVVWYDFRMNNPRNSDVKGIRRGEIKSLFGDCAVTLRSITLAPPVCRWISPYSTIACLLLEKIPALRTHYVGLISKRVPRSADKIPPTAVE